MKYRHTLTCAAAIGLTGALPTAAHCADFAVNSFSVLGTTQAKPDAIYGYGTGNEKLLTYQFEHFSGHSWGDVYFDAEVYHGRDVGSPFVTGHSIQNLMVLNPRLSLGKITGKDFSFGPVTDVSLISRWEAGSYPNDNPYRSQNYGVSLNFDVPGFSYFESGLLYRNTNFDKRTWLWRSVLMSKPVEVFSQKLHFNLLSLVSGSQNNGTEVFERGEMLWEVGGKAAYQLGLRLEYETYKNDPIKGGRYQRWLPMLMFKYTL